MKWCQCDITSHHILLLTIEKCTPPLFEKPISNIGFNLDSRKSCSSRVALDPSFLYMGGFTLGIGTKKNSGPKQPFNRPYIRTRDWIQA